MSSAKRNFTIVLEPDLEEGGFTVLVPALPGCVTQGETREECLDRAREAITGFLEELARDGKPVPSGEVNVEITTVQVELPV